MLPVVAPDTPARRKSMQAAIEIALAEGGEVVRDFVPPVFHNVFPVPPGVIECRVVQRSDPASYAAHSDRDSDFVIELASANAQGTSPALNVFPWLTPDVLANA